MTTSLAHGFASLNGGTTGGSGGTVVTVTTGAQLQAAINSVTDTSAPLTIYVDGKITPANSGVSAITVAGRDNISIIGKGAGAEFDGIGIHVTDGSSNLIIQNLKIHDVATGVKDAISIEGPSKNIWIDSNELYSTMAVSKDYYDGLLDIKRGAEYITVSNNHFHDHHKVSLVGYSDSDVGARFVTYNHNIFENIGSRAPSVRFGHTHVYENYYKDVSVSAINLRMGAVGLVENNVFVNVHNPIVSLDSTKIGYWDLRGNTFQNITWGTAGSNEALAGTGNVSTAQYNAPYSYTLVGAANVVNHVTARAGTGNLGTLPGDGTVVTPPTGPTPTDPPPTDPTPTDPTPAPSTLKVTSGADVVMGTAGDDRISAIGGADSVNGGAGNDVIDGGSSDDTLFGGLGNDTLFGGEGRDVLSGDAGNDVLDGGGSADRLDGGDGNDRLLGGSGDDVLTGGAGADTIEGGAGKSTISGGDGDDVVRGNTERDVMTGGLGRDVLTGGGGNDVFVYNSIAESTVGSGRDVITDFAVGDKIDLSKIDAVAAVSGDQAFAFLGSAAFSGKAGELHFVQQNGVTLVEGDVNGDRVADFQIELTGSLALKVTDFIL